MEEMSADIASAYGPVSEALLRDLEAYEGMKDELLRKYRDKVVAIKDGELVGVYEDEAQAYEDVVRKYGLVPVLIKRVEEVEELADMPAYVHGLLNARPL
ncbi:MAG: DUF5678 domain-containing protein [Conexivisphaera sp.]